MPNKRTPPRKMPKGMHKMPGSKMPMKDSDMEPMMGYGAKKKGKK